MSSGNGDSLKSRGLSVPYKQKAAFDLKESNIAPADALEVTGTESLQMGWEILRDVMAWEQQHINKLSISFKKLDGFSDIQWEREPSRFVKELYHLLCVPGMLEKYAHFVTSTAFDHRNSDSRHAGRNLIRYSISGRLYSRSCDFMYEEENRRGVHRKRREMMDSLFGRSELTGDPETFVIEKLGEISGGKPYVLCAEWCCSLRDAFAEENSEDVALDAGANLMVPDQWSIALDKWSGLIERLEKLVQSLKETPKSADVDALRVLCSEAEALIPELPQDADSFMGEFEERLSGFTRIIANHEAQDHLSWIDTAAVDQVSARWKMEFNAVKETDEGREELLADFERAEREGLLLIDEYRLVQEDLALKKAEISRLEAQLSGKGSLAQRRSVQRVLETSGEEKDKLEKSAAEKEGAILAAYSPRGRSFDFDMDYVGLATGDSSSSGSDQYDDSEDSIQKTAAKEAAAREATAKEAAAREATAKEAAAREATAREATAREAAAKEAAAREATAKEAAAREATAKEAAAKEAAAKEVAAKEVAAKEEETKGAAEKGAEDGGASDDVALALSRVMTGWKGKFLQDDLEKYSMIQRRWLEEKQTLRAWLIAEEMETQFGKPSSLQVTPAWLCRLLLVMSDQKLLLSDEEIAKATGDLYQVRTLDDDNKDVIVLWMAAELFGPATDKALRIARLVSPQQFELPQHSLALACADHLLAPVYSGNFMKPPTDQAELLRRYETALGTAKEILNPTRNIYQNRLVKSLWRNLVSPSGPMASLLASAREGRFPKKTLSSDDITSAANDWSEIVASYRHNILNRLDQFVACIEAARSAFNAVHESPEAHQATVSRHATSEILGAIRRQNYSAWWLDRLETGIREL